MLLIVWIVVPVLALLVLGVLGYGVFGAAGRLDRELQALEDDVRPVLAEAQGVAEKAAAQRAARSETEG
ncbi:hypothetical protein GCM10023328_12810 [Modestobacter marinus]|uniref:Heme/copper-type cytochrome/quinol oxidase subunit 2 n=1 Tax=Modestobacter marinus TaxID=477641 RepID=A0A846LRK5_9ACTN|nr:hypothetical protein [Modestobacter marinus]NIH69084.1 heme/copper-type cytochrome/quinol oxidase subunit 2 [Modestobacter marinus]GGL77654.1 hypothetical protein GCM10011589_37150 [Modestobacter marinus]